MTSPSRPLPVCGRLVVEGASHPVLQGETRSDCSLSLALLGLYFSPHVTCISHCSISRVGRDPGAHVYLQHKAVSSCHAVIEADIQGAFLYDVGSANGTKLNGVKLKPSVRYTLQTGAQILLGKTTAR